MTASFERTVTRAAALIGLILAGSPGMVLAEQADPIPAGVPPDRTLTREDVDSWLDGLLPYAIHSGHIAGGVAVVVKDGRVLTEKGYGYADVALKTPMDPSTTLIRPGSISKLFTWTAVMQLVERGTLDLDTDINRYLDFTVAPLSGEPITLRNIMTHTSGFEESLKDLDTDTPTAPLADYVRTHLPRRIYPPGKIPAYSNYATALAGYIVERTSHEPFDAYIERHILTPLGMDHSTFRQPLPEDLRPQLSRGYTLASLPPQYYEYCGPAPAGAMATTADDMARFMVAHLQNGTYGATRILSEQISIAMHTAQPKIYPALNGMALGFYETSSNGHRVIAHNGGTQFFHSDLHLFIDDGVGIFISLNSAGDDGAVSKIHDALFHGFADRYFGAVLPDATTPLISPIAIQHSILMAGTWENSRRSDSTFMKVTGFLEPMTITANVDGTITLPVPTRGAMSFREIGPFVWKEVDGPERIQALTLAGRPVMLGFGMAPPAAFLPIPGQRSPSWLLPAAAVALGALLLTGLSWPVAAIARRVYKVSSPLAGRPLLVYRALRAASLATVGVMLTFLGTLAYMSGDASRLSRATDGWIIGLQLAALIIVPGATVVCGGNAIAAWSEQRSWPSRCWAIVVLASCGVIFWMTLMFHLLIPNTHY
ncbi:MAG: beta-lactamase family protein [Pseudomonadota bacterium]|nr:beta-lactamase family protein [Pseudomonadota bacterium]